MPAAELRASGVDIPSGVNVTNCKHLYPTSPPAVAELGSPFFHPEHMPEAHCHQ